MINLWNNYQFRKQLNKFVEEYLKDEERAFPLFEALVKLGVKETPPLVLSLDNPLTANYPAPQEEPTFSIAPKKRRRRTKEQIKAGVTLDQLVDEEAPPSASESLPQIKAKLRSMAATPGRREAIKKAISPEEQRRIDEENRKNQADIMQRVKESADILLAAVKKDGFDSNGERKVALASHRYAGAQLNEHMASLGFSISVRKSMQNIHSGSNAEAGAGSPGGGWEIVVSR